MSDFLPGSYRVLVVDDSEITLKMVDMVLQRAGFQVLTAVSGEEALEVVSQHGLPHLALVDINLPFGMDGFEFCQTLLEYSDLPILMLTAVDEEDTIIHAIEQYAEDYMTKPFQPGELVARVRRVLRRIGDFAYPLENPTVVDEHLNIDFPGNQAFIQNQPIPLTPTETKLLYILMRSAGRLVHSDFLLKRLWPQEEASEERLRVNVHRLRLKLEQDANNPHYILSLRGKGYMFLANPNSSE